MVILASKQVVVHWAARHTNRSCPTVPQRKKKTFCLIQGGATVWLLILFTFIAWYQAPFDAALVLNLNKAVAWKQLREKGSVKDQRGQPCLHKHTPTRTQRRSFIVNIFKQLRRTTHTDCFYWLWRHFSLYSMKTFWSLIDLLNHSLAGRVNQHHGISQSRFKTIPIHILSTCSHVSQFRRCETEKTFLLRSPVNAIKTDANSPTSTPIERVRTQCRADFLFFFFLFSIEKPFRFEDRKKFEKALSWSQVVFLIIMATEEQRKK